MRPLLFAALFLTALAARSLATPGSGEHEDPRLGFKMSTPRGWEPIAQNSEERWVVGKYLSDKTDYFTDKTSGYTFTYKPDLTMIAFVAEAVRERTNVTEKEGKDGEKEISITFVNPYKDYMDFMKRRYSGGGFFKTSEEEIQVNDVRTTCLEIKVEKGSNEGPKRITTWIYHLQDVDVAVQLESLEDSYSKLQNEFQRCLKSFKPIPRTVGKLFEGPATGEVRASFSKIEKMSPEERKQYRVAQEKRSRERASENLPQGWSAKPMGRFLVVNHADEKYAKKVVEFAEAVWKWLDESFGFLGEKEYVRNPIIRICKNEAEMEAFWKHGQQMTFENVEIVTCQDRSGASEYELKDVADQLFQMWLRDRDLTLYLARPGWLTAGMSFSFATAQIRGGRLSFKGAGWTRDYLRERMREKKGQGRLSSAKEMMLLGIEDFDDAIPFIQAGTLTSYYLSDASAKNKKMKDLLPTYLRNLSDVARAIDKEEDASKKAKKDDSAKTEEEEDAQYKEKGQRFKRTEKRLLDETLRKTFEGWSQKDWDQLEAAYGDLIQ